MPEKRPKTERETAHIFDLTFKHILQEIGSAVVILFINGLFGRSHPLSAAVGFGKTETVKKQGKKLKNLRSDLILTVTIVGGEKTFEYAVEVQVKNDKTIGLRIFEYALEYAHETKRISRDGTLIELRIPLGCVIYWESTRNTPDAVTLRLRSEEEPDRYFDYKVRVFKMADQPLEALAAKNLLVLLPFCLVKFRKELKRTPMTTARRRALAGEAKALIDAMEAILLQAQAEGILSGEDAVLLMEHSLRMHDELYGDYPEFKEDQMVLDERFRSKVKAEWRAKEAALKAHEEERFQSKFKAEWNAREAALKAQWDAKEAALKAREARWDAEKEAALKAQEAELAQGAFKRGESKIIGLLKQGYTLEQIEELVAQEGASR